MDNSPTVLHKTVVLIGPSMSGKTTITARLVGDDKFVAKYSTIGK